MQADVIALHARLAPGRLAARDLTSGERWSYAELDALVGRMAAQLLAEGCQEGDRVCLLARNSVWFVALHYACARTGAIFVPLNWRLANAELETLLVRAEPTVVLGDEQAPALKSAVPMGSFADFVVKSAAQTSYRGRHKPDNVSLILFTSGTSGKPKGVMLTERNLQLSAVNFTVLTQVDQASTFLCDAPMFHVMGLVANVRAALFMGGTILVSDGFKVDRTLGWLSDPEMAITHYAGVPQMMESFRRQPGFDVSKLRHMTALVTGGAPHSPADIAAWLEDGVAMTSGFGMSETGTVFNMPCDAEAVRAKPGSVGVTTPWVEVRVVDGAGEDCPLGSAGEMLLRGENITVGYWRDPDVTAKAIDPDGWFATGDIVRMDEDGFCWILDRKKDMFISGGENVYPAEIEGVLSDYPGIAECAVVGVADPQWGEVGHLAIVPASKGAVDADAVLAFLREKLARYKVPKHVSVVENLPRTATGKLQKANLRKTLS